MKRVLVYGMTDNPGGIESYLLFILEKLKGFNIQLDFVTDFPTIAYEEQLRSAGSRIFYIPAKGKKLFKHWAGMRKILKENPEYNTVYFNLLDAGGVFTAIVAKLKGKKIIVHSHNADTDKVRLHKLCRPFLKMITDSYVACAKTAAIYMFGNEIVDKGNYLIIPNAIDSDTFEFNQEIRDSYREKMELKDKFVVLHVGRLTRQKNPYRLLDIFDTLYGKDKSAALLYVGDGEIKEDVYAYAKGKASYPNMKLLGVRKDIPELMQSADVFLLPSLYEGLAIVAVEAQAAGLPLIASANITEEIKITDNMSFVDLAETDEAWVEKILSYKGFNRESAKEIIVKAGYDKHSMSEIFAKLAECMK